MKDCLVEARFDYSKMDAVKTLNHEQHERLRQLGWVIPDVHTSYWHVTFLGMLSEVAKTKQEFEELGDIILVKIRGLDYDKDFVNVITDNHPFVGEPLPVGPRNTSPIQISVYNEALLSIKSIDWMEDACTQSVQEALNRDWKIIAVCPANDSRRPTYILGHRDEGMKI